MASVCIKYYEGKKKKLVTLKVVSRRTNQKYFKKLKLLNIRNKLI